MRDDAQATMVLVSSAHQYTSWTEKDSRHCIITLTNAPLFFAAFDTIVAENERELATVIFDQSLTPTEYLEFLSDVSPSFRGDVLLILKDGRGFMSAASQKDGRHLYKLTQQDVSFYIDTKFGENHEAPHRPLLMAV